MSVITFIGDTDFKPASDPVFTTSGYELDSAKVPYQGRVTTKADFVSNLKRFAALSDKFPRMFLDGSSDDGNKVFPTIDVNYTGFRGDIPPPKGVDSRAVKSFSLEAPADPNSGLVALSFSAGYYVPRTTWTWYTTDAPDPLIPKYGEARATFSPAGTLFNIRTTTGAVVAFAVAYKYAKLLKTQTIISDYVITDLAPSKLWMCSCIADREFTI